MTYIIIANGVMNDYSVAAPFLSGDFKLICCDGAVRHSFQMGIQPDFIVGDLDSADENILAYYKNNNTQFITFPAEKDETDSALAVELAIKCGATKIVLLGMTGLRLDHTMSNLGLLVKCDNAGISAVMVDFCNSITLISRTKTLTSKKGSVLSLIPFGGDAFNVVTTGLQYPLNGETLTFCDSRGVSNVFLGDRASVSLERGLLLAIQPNL